MKPVAPVTRTVALVSGVIMRPSRSLATATRRRRAATRTGTRAAAGGGSRPRARATLRRASEPGTAGAVPVSMARTKSAICQAKRSREVPGRLLIRRRRAAGRATPWPRAGVSVTVESVLVPTSSVPRSPRMMQLLRRSRVRLNSTRPVTPLAISRFSTASASTPPAASSQYSKPAMSPNHQSSRSRTWVPMSASTPPHCGLNIAADFTGQRKTMPSRTSNERIGPSMPDVEHVLRVAQRRREAAEQADREPRARALGRLDHRVALGGRQRHRLLDQHVDAGVQQVDGHRRVILVRDAENRRVDVRDRVAVVAIAGRHAELALHVLDAIRGGIDDRHGLDAGRCARAPAGGCLRRRRRRRLRRHGSVA